MKKQMAILMLFTLTMGVLLAGCIEDEIICNPVIAEKGEALKGSIAALSKE